MEHLIADSGIHFISREIEFNPSEPLILNNGRTLKYTFYDGIDFLEGTRIFDLMYYHNEEGKYIPLGELQTADRAIVRRPNGREELDESGLPVMTPGYPTTLFTTYNDDDEDLISINSLQSFRVKDPADSRTQVAAFDLLLDKWLPMPMFYKEVDGITSNLPLGWCRMKMTKIGEGDKKGVCKYRLVWAFDTQLGEDELSILRPYINREESDSVEFCLCNKADLYMTFDARLGSKQVTIPEVMVARGIIATSELYRRTVTTAQAAVAPDAYQRITKKKQEANIKFLIQQANLRKSELKNNSVKEFVRMLKQINDDREGLNLENVEVSAYASPDGGFSINDKLANQRQKVSEQYVNQELKKIKMNANVDAKYTAQDWEGFQELVKASNIQDKDIILRVLAMYKDPQEREQQIKNISSAFRELADGILPQLRRSRLIINYETIGRSDEQILDQIKADPKKLSAEELLYGAALKETPAEQEAVYKLATTVYPNDARAYNNLATLAYARGDYEAAKSLLAQALRIDAKLPEAKANQGLLALQGGDVKTAELLIASATDANGLSEIMGNLNLAKGNYAQAEQDFGDISSNSAALAQILNKNYAAAESTLKHVKQADAVTDYLKAITYYRMGNTTDAKTALQQATGKDQQLAKYAETDLEVKQ